MESKVILFLICISCISVGINCDYASDTIKKTQGVLVASKDVFANMADLITSANPGKLFAKISGFLGSLGPAAMALSAVLSIVTMFLPKEDSPELKAIKAGFEKVNNKLDIITSKIGSLENIIELSSARAAYVKTVTSINNNYEALAEAYKTQTKESFNFFAKQYENSFEFATANMYDAMTGATGPFGFNMVNLYKTHVKCNPILLSQFCTMGLHLINKGLSIEGSYLGYMNFTAKAKGKEETWKAKMDQLGQQCLAVIQSCENNWKDYAYQQFRETHREIGGDNQAFAERVVKDLANVAPQRSWLAVIYNDAGGFGPHTYSTYYEANTIWNEKEHDTTIFSAPKAEKLTGSAYDDLVKIINGQKDAIARVDDCQKTEFWLIKVNRYQNEDARTIVTKIREKYMTGVVYAIRMDYQPGQAVTGGTLYATDQKWQCTSEQFRLIIFQ